MRETLNTQYRGAINHARDIKQTIQGTILHAGDTKQTLQRYNQSCDGDTEHTMHRYNQSRVRHGTQNTYKINYIGQALSYVCYNHTRNN